MLRKVKAKYDCQEKANFNSSLKGNSKEVQKPKPRHIGKRRRQQILLGENNNPNKLFGDRTLVSSIRFDTFIKKRDRKKCLEEYTVLSKIQMTNNISSTSTSFTIGDKTKRREYQGNKVYRKQKGGKAAIDLFKHGLKSQKTGKWKYFDLYNEGDLKGFESLSMQLIDNEVDDDCDTDDETLTNGQNYNRKKLLEGLQIAVQKQLRAGSKDD